MTVPGPENEGGAERPRLCTAEVEVFSPAAARPEVPSRHDAGQALDAARTLDRLRWEERCEDVQRQLNSAYTRELGGKAVRRFAGRMVWGGMVVLLMSCFTAWTGGIAILICLAALAIALLGLVIWVLGVATELFSQLRKCWLLARGVRDHLEVCDPNRRTTD